jgi:hypothetical protein
LKTVVPATVPRVRIPPLPPEQSLRLDSSLGALLSAIFSSLFTYTQEYDINTVMNEFLYENPQRRGFELAMALLGGIIAVNSFYNLSATEAGVQDDTSALADIRLEPQDLIVLEQANQQGDTPDIPPIAQLSLEVRQSMAAHQADAEQETTMIKSSSIVGGLAALSLATGFLSYRRKRS